MKLKDALHILSADTELTAWSVSDYVQALETVLASKRISKTTRAYATGVLMGMLLVISEVEAAES